MGFPSVCAVPMRLNDVILGCMNLFMSEPVALSAGEVAIAQALADVASIAIVQDLATRQAVIREDQLQHALNSRIAIEQAKGMIAERGGMDMDDSFAKLRSFARNNNRGLTEVAEALVAGTLPIEKFQVPHYTLGFYPELLNVKLPGCTLTSPRRSAR